MRIKDRHPGRAMRTALVPPALVVLLGAGLLTTGSGCGEKAPLKLTTRQWARVDTLLQERLPGLRAEMDSLCEVHFEERLQHAVDSILAIRLEEEKKLRSRIPLK